MALLAKLDHFCKLGKLGSTSFCTIDASHVCLQKHAGADGPELLADVSRTVLKSAGRLGPAGSASAKAGLVRLLLGGMGSAGFATVEWGLVILLLLHGSDELY